MFPAQVVGHAVSSHSHPSLKGCKMMLCQPLDAEDQPLGAPIVAIDLFGAGLHSKVIVSTDGVGARHLVHDEKSPIRNFIQGVVDDKKLKTKS
ncbi:MAG: EutN/CcmL family microcompartment protein [Verrucomicrobiota bacterium]